MSEAAVAGTLDLLVSDVTGQKNYRASGVPTEATVREFVQSLLARLGLAPNDAHGRPLNYAPRLERTGRQLNGSEIVGDALQPGDKVRLLPSIDAGCA